MWECGPPGLPLSNAPMFSKRTYVRHLKKTYVICLFKQFFHTSSHIECVMCTSKKMCSVNKTLWKGFIGQKYLYNISNFYLLLNRQNTCFFYNNIIHQSSSCSGSQPYPSSPSSGSYWHPSGIPTCGTGTNQSVGRPSRAKAARPASTASCEFVIAKSP